MDFDKRTTDAGIRMVQFSFSKNEIKALPNPFLNNIEVHFGTGIFHKLDIRTVDGKIIESILLNSSDRMQLLNLSGLASGIYFIHLIGNERTEVRKIVKE